MWFWARGCKWERVKKIWIIQFKTVYEKSARASKALIIICDWIIVCTFLMERQHTNPQSTMNKNLKFRFENKNGKSSQSSGELLRKKLPTQSFSPFKIVSLNGSRQYVENRFGRPQKNFSRKSFLSRRSQRLLIIHRIYGTSLLNKKTV